MHISQHISLFIAQIYQAINLTLKIPQSVEAHMYVETYEIKKICRKGKKKIG